MRHYNKDRIQRQQIPVQGPTYLLSNLLIQSEAGQYGQREDHHSQTVVSQEVDQSTVEWLHVVLQVKARPVSLFHVYWYGDNYVE